MTRLARRGLRRGVLALTRRSPPLRLGLICGMGVCLSLALAASTRVVWAAASAQSGRTQSGANPFAVRQISVRGLHGRIVGTATIVNRGPGTVRSTTGVLSLRRGTDGTATGLLAFSVPTLPPWTSTRVRLTTPLLRTLPLMSGTYEVLICADVYSQIERFAEKTNCWPAASLTISTIRAPRPSGPVPKTSLGPGLTGASATRGSTAVFRFASTVARSDFRCSLDGGPWLACRSPQAYAALVPGPHAFAVRAISPSGAEDPTPARTWWTARTVSRAATPTTPEIRHQPPARASIDSGAGTTTAATASAFSIGGSVSGLSGTVVLQDNGGDDLSVSANGAFTFATPLVSGVAYTVTVKANPSGQTCSVANGTGTVATANITNVAITCSTSTTSFASDNFNRANGGLGASWAAMSDGGLSIVSQQVVGTANALAGDIRAGESYGSDQYSQLSVTSTQLSGGQWIGPSVRSQNGGQNTYLGIYFWNNGTPQLRLYKRTSGTFTQLGASYNSGPLPAGTTLTLTAVGSTIALQQNGITRISVTDSTLTGGTPGLMSYDTATADNWAGGTGAPPPPPSFSIGGSVSGLSGTVVLQDNGGDDLSVSANGAFTFATPLVSGVAYTVTVKANPSGQTCSVANGTGTVATANITNVAITCSTSTTSFASDNFNRANGGLGASWAAMSDGGLSIVSQQVVGTANALAGDIRAGESYGSDQYSQLSVTSTQLSGGQWIGPSVRSQNGGQNTYLGIYFWNNGTPQLRLYKRTSGTFTQLGASYNSGPLPAGTTLTLTAVGSTIALQQNGITRISVTDSTLTGGTPGLMSYDTATADNWAGGTGAPPPPPSFSIGGSVSGLSGTVVLQDNGGDDLSVSANGAFTFATPLVSGVAYTVTVKANPSGQTCSVANGTGTVATANITNVAITCSTSTTSFASDNFNRANGGLGASWAAMSDGGLSIVSQQVVGTANALAGDIRAGESYGSDQYSQLSVTSTQLSGGQWIGPSVRSQNGGQNTYLGIYFWNNGTPQLRLYKRTSGTFTQLGASYNSGPLPAGTTLTLTAVGSTIALQQNGITRISVTDSTLTGGTPGLMSYDTATADNWAGGTGAPPPPPSFSIGGSVSGLSGTVVLQDNGGDDLSVSANGAFTFATPLVSGVAYTVTVKANPSGQTCSVANGTGTVATANITNVAITCSTSTTPTLQIQYSGTDTNGVASYNYTSPDDGYGTHVLRVLAPTNPTPGAPHRFLYVLPVEPELGTVYGDGIDTLRNLNAQNQYNLTIVEPSFADDPWYADNPNDSNLHYETFLTSDLVPWVTQNLTPSPASQLFAPVAGQQNWLIGFSKSGIGGEDLLLKHPDIFSLAASWDFPADMSTYNQFGSSSANNYGTDTNFQANYRLTRSFVDAHKAAFLSQNRIWIGGYEAFQSDMTDYDALLTAEGIQHTTETPTLMAHRWDSGWVPIALSALSQDGGALAATP